MPRIVSLISSGTEIVHALDQLPNQVGRSHECDFPETVLSLPICTRPTIPATDLTDEDVAAQLIAQIGAGALPPPRVAFGGPITEYYVMFPPTYSICLGTDCSDVTFCAYHSDAVYAGTPFTYTVLPESTPPDPGCGANFGGGGFGNLTSMTSHEMVESMTDPEVGSATVYGPPLAWFVHAKSETM